MGQERRMIDVQTGAVEIGLGNITLVSSAIGSCIVIGLYDPLVRAGGLAHAMLPGGAPEKEADAPNKYIQNAAACLVQRLLDCGARPQALIAFVVGGANVLQRHSDTICEANIGSALQTLYDLNLPLAASSLGGFLRRRVTLDCATGEVLCGIGDSVDSPLVSLQEALYAIGPHA